MTTDNKSANEKQLPTVEHLCLQASLYFPFKLDIAEDDAARNVLFKLRMENFQFDAHCVGCGKPSTFKTLRAKPETRMASITSFAGQPPPAEWLNYGQFGVEVRCQRNISHRYNYYFCLSRSDENSFLQKVGQFPSLEEIATSDLQKYRKILGAQNFQELHRAGGLHSHGIGIGAFVYLRRIFERLIGKARDRAIEAGMALTDFEKARMDEKIGQLKSWLPPALVKNKAVYKILSKGLHELDEDTCRKYFPIMKLAIIDILEQDLAEETRRKAEEDLARAIGEISAELSATEN